MNTTETLGNEMTILDQVDIRNSIYRDMQNAFIEGNDYLMMKFAMVLFANMNEDDLEYIRGRFDAHIQESNASKSA